MKADKSSRDNHLYSFGPFRLNAAERHLVRDGEPVTIPPKAFDTLVVLVKNQGHAVRKDELISAVWPDTFVDENNLNQYISVLRKALGENGDGQRFIETVPRWGYRFVGDVHELDDEDGEVTVHRRTRASVVVRDEVAVVPAPATVRIGPARRLPATIVARRSRRTTPIPAPARIAGSPSPPTTKRSGAACARR